MNRDVALGCLMLVVAGGYYAAATLIPESQLDDAVGPQGLPRIYAVVLVALSLILIAKSAKAAPDEQRYAVGGVAGMLLIGVLYIVAVPWVGYVPSIAALILVTIHYQGGAINRRVVLVSVSGAAFFWLLFVFVLGIPQPAGPWSSLF